MKSIILNLWDWNRYMRYLILNFHYFQGWTESKLEKTLLFKKSEHQLFTGINWAVF